MAAWMKEEENTFKHWQRKRGAEEPDKVEVVPGVILASLRRCRAALIVMGHPSSTGLRLTCDGLDGANDVSLECT